MNGVADLLSSYNHYLGTPDFLAADLARYEDATPDAVQFFAKTQLNPNQRVVVYAVPGKQDLGPEAPTPPAEAKGSVQAGGEAVNADAAWRDKPPAPVRRRCRTFRSQRNSSFRMASRFFLASGQACRSSQPAWCFDAAPEPIH